MKKILVPGGTGAMGVYLVPELLKLGYSVDVLSLDDVNSDNPNLRYIQGNAMDYDYIAELLNLQFATSAGIISQFLKNSYRYILQIVSTTSSFPLIGYMQIASIP